MEAGSGKGWDAGKFGPYSIVLMQGPLALEVRHVAFWPLVAMMGTVARPTGNGKILRGNAKKLLGR